MNYLPSRKFFYIVFFTLFALFLVYIFSHIRFPGSSDNNNTDNSVKVVAGVTSQNAGLPTIDENATSTLLKKAFYYDELQQQMANGSTTIVQTAVEDAAKEIQDKKAVMLSEHYSIANIKITEDNSIPSIKEYGNTVAYIYKTSGKGTPSKSEVDIIKKAIEGNDATALKDLDPYIDFYKKAVSRLLSQQVPSKAAKIHLDIINSLASLLAIDEGYRTTFDNVSPSIAALYAYPTAAKKLMSTFQELGDFFQEEGVIYSPQEDGYGLTMIKLP